MKTNSELPKTLNQIIINLNFPDLFKSYTWVDDTWERGFPDLFRLEKEISSAARQNTLGRDHLVQIARWGKLPNINRIACPEPIKIGLYQNDLPASWLLSAPHNTILLLQHQITGFGPTYISKLLHFAIPQVCGALDTRLVRVFGKKAQEYQLLNLYATEMDGRWAIPATQAGWPSEYSTWIKILQSIADNLNNNRIECPHPQKYIESGLRKAGVWLPADVETALFAYASKKLQME
jgi:hypothetical protein